MILHVPNKVRVCCAGSGGSAQKTTTAENNKDEKQKQLSNLTYRLGKHDSTNMNNTTELCTEQYNDTALQLQIFIQ